MRKEFEKLVAKYVDKLLEGTDYKLDFWVADVIGGVAAIDFDVYMSFDDIRYCVDNNISVEKYYDYQEWTVKEHFKKPEKKQYKDYVTEKFLKSSVMNFKSWIKQST
jgi:hypothetical protein